MIKPLVAQTPAAENDSSQDIPKENDMQHKKVQHEIERPVLTINPPTANLPMPPQQFGALSKLKAGAG